MSRTSYKLVHDARWPPGLRGVKQRTHSSNSTRDDHQNSSVYIKINERGHQAQAPRAETCHVRDTNTHTLDTEPAQSSAPFPFLLSASYVLPKSYSIAAKCPRRDLASKCTSTSTLLKRRARIEGRRTDARLSSKPDHRSSQGGSVARSTCGSDMQRVQRTYGACARPTSLAAARGEPSRERPAGSAQQGAPSSPQARVAARRAWRRDTPCATRGAQKSQKAGACTGTGARACACACACIMHMHGCAGL